MFTFRRFAAGGFAAAVSGAVLGGVIAFMQMSTHLPADKVDTSAIITFQNFVIAVGIGAGVLLGFAGAALFLILLKRFQYPVSTSLGAWLGCADGALLCLMTSLIINASADSFKFLPSVMYVWVVNTLITVAIGGVVGLCAGYLMAEIGARNLR